MVVIASSLCVESLSVEVVMRELFVHKHVLVYMYIDDVHSKPYSCCVFFLVNDINELISRNGFVFYNNNYYVRAVQTKDDIHVHIHMYMYMCTVVFSFW